MLEEDKDREAVIEDGSCFSRGGQGRVFQEGCLAADLNGEKQGAM